MSVTLTKDNKNLIIFAHPQNRFLLRHRPTTGSRQRHSKTPPPSPVRIQPRRACSSSTGESPTTSAKNADSPAPNQPRKRASVSRSPSARLQIPPPDISRRAESDYFCIVGWLIDGALPKANVGYDVVKASK